MNISVSIVRNEIFASVDGVCDELSLHEKVIDNEPKSFERLLARLGQRIDDARAANVKPAEVRYV